MARKVFAGYSILVGVCMLGMWSMILLTGGVSEGTIEISLHLVSEFLTAILLLISGICVLKNKVYGNKLSLISNGMLIYSVLNAAGYYGQRGNLPMLCMFTIIFIISTSFLVLELIKREVSSIK